MNDKLKQGVLDFLNSRVSMNQRYTETLSLSTALQLRAYYKYQPQQPFKRAKQGQQCVLFYPSTNKIAIANILSECPVLFDYDETLFINTDVTGIVEFRGVLHESWYDGGRCHVITDLKGYMDETGRSELTMCGLARKSIIDICREV